MDLNFASFVDAFLCLDQPTVINAIAIILTKGCSSEVKRKEASFIWPNTADPNGDTKYNTKPTNNWVWVPIKAKRAIFLSLGVNSLLELFPIKEFTTAITNTKMAKKAQPEWNCLMNSYIFYVFEFQM